MPDATPNPGSPEAERQGCTCPVIDNGHGRGAPQGGFIRHDACPVHGWPAREIETEESDHGG